MKRAVISGIFIVSWALLAALGSYLWLKGDHLNGGVVLAVIPADALVLVLVLQRLPRTGS